MNMPEIQLKTTSVHKMLRAPSFADIVPTLLLFLAARANVMNLFPFGLALFAAIYDKRISYIGVTAMAVAAVGIMPNEEAVQYILAAVLFWLYSGMRDEYGKGRIFSSVVCGACMLISGCAVMIYKAASLFVFMELIAESIISAFMYIVFGSAYSLIKYSRSSPSKQEIISGALCAGVFISGVADIMLPLGINLSRCLTAFAVMSLALSQDIAVAGCGGLAAGLVCSMANPAAITLMGMYGFGAIGANLFKFLGKYGVGMGFIAASSVAMLYIGNSLSLPLSPLEIMLSAIAFICTPASVHEYIRGWLERGHTIEEVAKEDRSREYMCARLANVRNALASLAECFKGVTERRIRMYNRDSASILNETCERVCTGCADRHRCWGGDFSYSWRRVMNLLEVTETQGTCRGINIPPEFKSMCICPEAFVQEFNHVYELFKTERIFADDAVRSRDLLYYQYTEFTRLTDGIIREMESGFEFSEKDEERIAEALGESGISLREISVVESADRGTEVYMKLNSYPKIRQLEEILTECLGVPIIYEATLSGGLMKFVTCGGLDVISGSCRVAKENEKVCGDSLTVFRTQDYKFYIIICDGMGSGKNAGRDSYISGRLLEKFIRAGFSAKLAINMVNSSLALRLDHEGFSSVDMLCIDLLTGQADFYKTGGSKSYIRHNEEIETVFSEGLPAGVFKKLYIKGISKHVEEGDIVVMMSDGAADVGYGILSSERIIKAAQEKNADMDAVAKEIVKAAIKKKRGRISDDITVATVKIVMPE